MPRAPEFPAGTVLGERFRIVRPVGAGGMGTVYEAIDLKLDRRIALKCARPGYQKRLPPEARAAREVSHPNVCKVHDLHTLSTPDGEMDCLSMEFIEGETLSQRIRTRGPLAGREAHDIACQICAGLAQAHRQGVFHGDLKCGNVILAPAPEGVRAAITDFGLSRIAGEDRDDAVAGGTRDYRAPESFLGEPPSAPSDIYSLGILFHVMLAGDPPRRLRQLPLAPSAITPGSNESTVTTLHGLVESDWQREIEPLPAPWKRIVTRCAAPLPSKRPASVAAVLDLLLPRRRLLKIAAAIVFAAALIAGGRQWRTPKTFTPVRLAILPFAIDAEHSESLAAVAPDVADRLSGGRRQFTVISPGEASRNQVDTAAKAFKALGATHALETRIHVSGGALVAAASLIDLQSGRTIRHLESPYQPGDTAALAKALVATIAEAFDMAPGAARETVSPAAYPYYVRAIDLLRSDHSNAEQAIPLFRKAMELDPRSALPYAGLAEAQIQRIERGNAAPLDEAEAASAKAEAINPDSVPVLLVSSFVQQERGHYEAAIQRLTRATEIAPEDPEPWRRLALCYERANRPDDALAAYKKAIQVKPDYYRPYLTLGTFFFSRGQYARAEEQYRLALAAAPELESGHMNLGLALMQERNFPEAEKHLLEALRLRPSANVLMNIGSLYYEQERFDAAADYYRRSLSAGAPSAMLLRNLGDSNRHLHNTRETKDAYARAKSLAEEEIKRNPSRAPSHSMLGLLCAFLGDTERARFELSQALAYDAENRSVIRDAAIAYESMGAREEALAALRAAPRSLLEAMNHHPDLKGLSGDSRFQSLLSNTQAH